MSVHRFPRPDLASLDTALAERRALSERFWSSQGEVRRRVERRERSPWQGSQESRRDEAQPGVAPSPSTNARGPHDASGLPWLTRLRQEPEWVLLGAATLVGVFLGLGLAALLSVFGGLR